MFKKLTKLELNEMSQILSLAFNNHENFKYLIKDDTRRAKATKFLFRSMMKVINEFGFIYVVDDGNDTIGYVTYMDDSYKTINLMTIIKTHGLGDMLRFISHLKISELVKYIRYLSAYKKLEHKKDGVIHLYITGVKPSHKGKGYMGKSFNDSLNYFKDQNYTGVALETSDSSNVSLYKHLNFQVVQTVKTRDEQQEIFFFEKKL